MTFKQLRFSKTILILALLELHAARVRADAEPPLRLVQTIPLPGVRKRIDHLAVDLTNQRLFVAALGNGTIEVVDLSKGKRIRSITGLVEPQGVAYLPDLNRLIVANGGGNVVAFDATTFKRLATIEHLDDADNLRVEPATQNVYVGYGDGALAVFDPKTMRLLRDIKLPGHPESFRLSSGDAKAYVNVPHTKEIVVIDRARREISSKMRLGAFSENFPMALDEAKHRLFVGTRDPARLLVFDTNLHAIADVSCVGDTDDLFLDLEFGRLYVTGGEGFVDVFDVKSGGRYPRIARLPTAAGARTSLWVPALRRLFVAAPNRDGREAAILVFETATRR